MFCNNDKDHEKFKSGKTAVTAYTKVFRKNWVLRKKTELQHFHLSMLCHVRPRKSVTVHKIVLTHLIYVW